ncbi:MAG: hypothetical protein UT00_C0017G0012 [Parcubacteria group bacterium GW2011_GWA1_38_7]|nr:MAG: hypothetical protein UT00_C0017G0012 [Parcubacteria group bacterium GW2011_GWA1_38_7]
MAEKPKFNPYALAHEYAGYYGIGMNEGETEDAFKSRVAGTLRERGSIIEAHEAFSGKRWDAEDQGATGPMSGILGAVAQTMQGREYSPRDPERQIGDDIAAGVYVKQGEDPVKSALAAIFDTLGAEAGMSLIDAMTDDKSKNRKAKK